MSDDAMATGPNGYRQGECIWHHEGHHLMIVSAMRYITEWRSFPHPAGELP
jgi:hypothetical protein